jgi:hypothetical protein
LHIDAEADREFLYTRTPPPEPLRRSIAARGVLTPLVATCDGKLVCGVRRLCAARDLALSEVPVVRAEHAADAFLAGVWENVAHRRFEPLELAALFERLEHIAGIDRATIAATYLPACGLEPSPIVLAKYLALAALPAAVAALPLRESHLFLIAECAPDDAAALARIFAAAQPSAGEARAVRDLLADIAVRERSSIAASASAPAIAEILAADTPPRLKVPALRSALRHCAFPHLSALENSAKAAAARGGLSGHIEVRLPPDLEGNDIEIRLRIKHETDAVRAATTLASDRGRAAIAALLAILRGERT